MKRITALMVSSAIFMGVAVNTTAAVHIEDTANYLIDMIKNPTVASVGGEWTVIGLARSGLDIDKTYFENYYNNVESYTKAKDGKLHGRKYTEYARVVIALTAIEKNPESVAGYNLVAPLLDYDSTIWQGINGAVWALIALDSGNYGTEDIRDKYIANILESEKKNGGWSLSEGEQTADVDMTAMALTAISKYQDRADVKAATDRGVAFLSQMQNEKGGYFVNNRENAESVAQVIVALSALGISCNDARFMKNGSTLIDNLYSFYQKDGSFAHTDDSDFMATEQCFYALVAAKRFNENKSHIFDITDSRKGDSYKNAECLSDILYSIIMGELII